MLAINLVVTALMSVSKGESDLNKLASTYQNIEQWQKRVETVRHGILQSAQLWPIPEKTPLRPRIHSRRTHNGYIVENIAFESLPGFFVTGNLYRPLEVINRSPIILCHTDILREVVSVKTCNKDVQPSHVWEQLLSLMTWLDGKNQINLIMEMSLY